MSYLAQDPHSSYELTDSDTRWIEQMEMKIGRIGRADGSCQVKLGGNNVICAVYGPREVYPRHLQDSLKAIVQCKYNLAPFSSQERKRPGPDRRSTEISRILGEALEEVMFVQRYPKTSIDIYFEVMEASIGIRWLSLVAASMALVDAGIPIKELASGCSVVVDGSGPSIEPPSELSPEQTLVEVGTLGDSDKFIMFQVDGGLSQDDMSQTMDVAQAGSKMVYDMQKEMIRGHFAQLSESDEEVGQ